MFRTSFRNHYPGSPRCPKVLGYRKRLLSDVIDPWKYTAADRLVPLLELSSDLHVIEESMNEIAQQREDRLQRKYADSELFGDLHIDLMYSLHSADCLLYASVFIYIYATFEAGMLEFCKQKGDSHLLKVSDINGNGIERYKTYLSKVVQIPFNFGESTEWFFLRNYSMVRNCLVHNSGCVEGMSKPEKLHKLLESHSTLNLDDGRLVITKDFCKEAIDTCKAFWASVIRAEAAQQNLKQGG